MCIRDRAITTAPETFDAALEWANSLGKLTVQTRDNAGFIVCLLYTSDAADDLLCVDLGGRRLIKKKTTQHITIINNN